VEASVSGESLLSLMTWAMWGMVALCGLFYFVSCYSFEILAQKLDEPRWMAWVPLANALLMMRLVGWEKWFWVMLAGYLVAMSGVFLPGPLMMLAALVMFPLALIGLVVGFAYFPKLATRRNLPMAVGLWVVLPQFAPPFIELVVSGTGVWVSLLAAIAASIAFSRILFHDGRPKYGPHPIGYALTLLGVIVMGAVMHSLPGRLAEEDGFQEAWQELATRLEETPVAGIREWGDASEAVAVAVEPAPSALDEPDPVEIAERCPPGTREKSGPEDGGRGWWCEIEAEGRTVRHGPARSWFDNGFLASEGEYDHGRRTGTWTRYWRSGGRGVQAEFRDDLQHGWMHRWDEFGNFETAVHYQAGEPGPP
jgi:hypothetical protein